MRSLLLIPLLLIVPLFINAQNDPHFSSGMVKQKVGNHEGAIFDFTESIKEHNNLVQKYLKSLEDYNKLTDNEKKEKNLKEPQCDPALASSYFYRGKSYSLMGKNDYAINDFNTVIKLNPKMGAAYFERGKILWSIGKKDESCIDFGKGSSLRDSLARDAFDEHFCWKEAVIAAKDASSKLRLNDFQGALDQIQPALKLCPDSGSYLGIRGRAYLGLGIVDLAMKDFNKALSSGMPGVDVYLGLGMSLYLQSKYQEAFDHLTKAIELNSKLADAYLYRAYCCEGLGLNQSALFDYQQVLKLKPGNASVYLSTAKLKEKMNDHKGACLDYGKAADLGNAEAQDLYEKCIKEK